jgi:hypothetical protein
MIWEYKTVVTEIRTQTFDIQGVKGFDAEINQALLNQFGMEQWELVSTNTVTANGHSFQMVYFFKRAISGKNTNLPEIGFDVDKNGLTGSQR